MSEQAELPASWLSLQLGEVVDYGKTAKAEPEEIPSDAWVLELEDIEKDTSKLLQRVIFSQRKSKSTKNRFASGDVLYGKLRPYLNKVLIADTEGYCTTEIVPLKPNLGIDGRYLFYWLKHPQFLEYVESTSHGLSMPRLGTEAGLQAPFVLAPLNEQRRIADKLDTLLAQIDACRERLDRVSLILKSFRQAVLAAATSGQLTEEWREREGTGKRDNVLELLSSIRTRRKQLYEQLYKKTKREERRRPASFKMFPDLEEQRSDLPEIPSDWEWISFGELLASFRSGSAGVPKNEKTEYPILRSSSVRPGSVDLEDVRFLTEAQSTNKDNFLQEGDLLFTRLSGSLEYVANCAIVRSLGNRKVQYPDRLFCAQLVDRHLTPYSEICFGSPILRKFITVEAKSSAGHQRISMSAITDQPIPLPPLGEQHEIARRVKVLFAFADRLETRYSMLRSQVEDLTPAFLAKAFRGELVPQDPNDEPASVLLERVRAGQALAEEAKTRRRQIRGRAKLKTKSKAEVIMLNRKDVQLSHLSIILKTRGPLTAEDLWSSSQLEIDDFYDQLKDEEANGLLKEIKKDDPGVQRLLEAA